MPYIKKTTVVGDKVYVEKVFSARYGKHTIPGPKKKQTREVVRKQKERERIKKLNWLIEANFTPGDWHVTLTFRKEHRTKDKKVLSELIGEFFRGLKKIYRQAGYELKYIRVCEKQKTGVHYHLIVNDIPRLAKALTDLWKHGRVYTMSLYESADGFAQLASYLLKEVAAGEKGVRERSYTHSRNLTVPETKVEVIQSRRWAESPKPKKGYYIQPDSLRTGVSDITGYMYQYYTMVRYVRYG